MNVKWLIAAGILVGIGCASYGVYNMNMNIALLSILGVFTLTNLMRAQAFKDQGLVREAKWMTRIAISFIVLFTIVFVVTIIL